jgi:hypothetical protein
LKEANAMDGKTHSAADDLIRGAGAIGKELSRSARWVYGNKGKLPLFYESGMLCAFKAALAALERARAERLDALRAEMTKEAGKTAPVIGERRTRGRKPQQQARPKRRPRQQARAASPTATSP